jgi:hypothetical protein
VHLLEPLVNGVRGAESGSVDLYRRGTTTRVTYYTTFEGDGATTPTSSVALDTYGGGVFYVNEETLVVVKDSTGTELRRFVSASAASGVEVISQSFTGTDYASGASAHTEPTPLSTVLDGLYTSFGARDFNVLYGGASITMQSLAAKVGTLFFNVKDPDYGAVGDGTTNDLAAIQEAVDAAETAGGGIVFFPKGIYNVGFSTPLDVPAGVSLLGAGPGVSVLRRTLDAGAEMVTFGAASYFQSVENLSFATTTATTREGIGSSAASRVLVHNCTFGDVTNTMDGIAMSDSGCFLTAVGCIFFPGSSGEAISGAGRFTAELCEVTLPATYNSTVFSGAPGNTNGLRLLYNKIIAAAMAAGTGTIYSFSGASTHVNSTIVGNLCDNPAGGTLNVSVGPGINSAGANTHLELGNDWGTSLVRSALWGDQATATTHTASMVMERESSRYYTLDETAAVAISAVLHATATIKRAAGGAQTVTLDGPGPANKTFSLVYYNSTGGLSDTITMAGNVKGLTTFTVNAASFSVYTFKAIHVQTTKFWCLIGSLTNQTP